MREREGRRHRRLDRSVFYLTGLALLFVSGARAQESTESTANEIPLAVVPGFTAMRVASGLTQPVFVTAPPGDVNHIYIVEQTGLILSLDLGTGQLSTFFTLQGLTSTSGEQGLLGMAFDPNYATNGKFYLDFTVPGGAFGNGVTHVSQFQLPPVKKKKKRKKKHTSTEVVLLTYAHPQTNHNGGWIGFSPRSGDDNNLYIATGDGGSGNDQGTGHLEPGGNAQSNTTLLGKMLRIHVDSTTGAVSIPSDNPFFSSGTFRREIWVFGLRNPFRASFDRQTGRMYMGDVGQNTREEIDAQEATNPGGGENYGWRLREGTIATPTGNPVVGGSPPPGNVEPIIDYGRSTGGTIIGGYVYRGSQVPALQGKYVFGDYLSGKIFSLDYDGTTASNFTDITPLLFPTRQGGFTLSAPSSFGEDANGELYIVDIGAGAVYKIVP
jgi:glucose/arabinose dehydrogenase